MFLCISWLDNLFIKGSQVEVLVEEAFLEDSYLVLFSLFVLLFAFGLMKKGLQSTQGDLN